VEHQLRLLEATSAAASGAADCISVSDIACCPVVAIWSVEEGEEGRQSEDKRIARLYNFLCSMWMK